MTDVIVISEFAQMSKRDIQQSAHNAASIELAEGNTNPLERFILAKRAITFLEGYSETLKPQAMTEAEKYGKSGNAYASKFELKNSGDRYDYSSDPVYAQIEAQLKARKELLDVARKSKDSIFDSEGVEVPKVPVKSHGSNTIAITF